MSAVPDQAVAVEIDDDKKLEELGYIPSFKREFSNLATVRRHSLQKFPVPSLLAKSVQISFAFSIMVFPSARGRKSSCSPDRVPGPLLQRIYDI